MALNVVEILVRAKNETEAAFAEADASATGFSKALKASMFIGAAATAVVGYEAVKMAMSFQSAMTMLNTQAGVPKSALKGLSAGVLQLAGTVGFSPDSLAESLYHVASNMQSLGATAPQMLGVVKVAAEGAKVGGADLVDVTNALTSAVASGIPGVHNYSQAMGMLNAIVGTGDMTMQNLADSMSTGLLPVMKQYGLTLTDVGAALATFGDLNIRGQKAATDLRMAVQAMTVPTLKGQDDFQKMGMSVTQLAGDLRTKGLMGALEDLKKHYAAVGITGTKVGEALTADFGKKAGVGLAVLLGNMDRLKSKYPDLIKGAKDFGGAWATTNDTLKQKLDELKGKFDALMVSVGEKLIPVLTRLAGWILSTLIPAIGKLVNWMSRHRDIVIAVAAGIMSLLVPAFVAWAIAAGTAAIETIIAVAPLVLIAAGVALVVYAILQLAHHWKAVWRDIKAWTLDTWHVIDGVVHDIVHAFDNVKHATDNVIHAFDNVRHFVAVAATDTAHAVETAFDTVKRIFLHDIPQWISDGVNWFRELPGKILHALGNLGTLLWNAGKSLIEGLIHGIESAVGGLLHTVSSLAGDVEGAFKSVLGIFSPSKVFEQHGRNIVQGLVNGINAAKPLAVTAMRSVGLAGLPGGTGGLPGGAGGGPLRIQIEFTGGDGPIIEAFKNAIRIRGGGGINSVQRALGQTS